MVRRLGLASRVPAPALLALPAAALLALPAAAQDADLQREIRESEARLDEIREERRILQQEMNEIRTRVADVSSQLRNIEQQLSASRSVLSEIDFQMEATEERARENAANLLRTRGDLELRTAALHQRLREIYKRGPLHTVEVLLGADSFADLLNRYRYLHLMARHDRLLLEEVRALEGNLEGQDTRLRGILGELQRLRNAQMDELAALEEVEAEWQAALADYRSRQQRTRGRLEELEEQEIRLAETVAELESRRRDAERRRAEAGEEATPARLGPADRGGLEWPVEGEVAYDFGPERRSDGTVLRWNGIGIRAPEGEPVRAVRGGTVVLAGPFEGYGPSVIVSHGDGYYTLYLYLEEVGVVQGRPVEPGQVVGTVGGSGTPEGPRLEFQIRAPGSDGRPEAVDPREWLQPREGGEG